MRALVVEDSPDVAEHVAEALVAAGFVVDHARDGEDAWFRGDTENYDAVVLDLGLPRLDGLSVLKRWRGADRLFPVLILSARGDWIEKVEGIEAGADDYLGKPFDNWEDMTRAGISAARSSDGGRSWRMLGEVPVHARTGPVHYHEPHVAMDRVARWSAAALSSPAAQV